MAEHLSDPAEDAAEDRFYADGHPLDEVHYLEAKVILNGLRFTSVQSFHDFGKLVRKAAKEARIDFETERYERLRPQIREVLFLDTKEFKLYNHAFILRRRTVYEDGFPVGEPEIVFKFRHPDLDTASQLDIRPNIPGMYRVKFKEEWLPRKDRIGGMRSLYSHNVEFKLDPLAFSSDLTAHEALVEAFPALRPLMTKENERLELVNRTAVEEVQQKLGALDFGKDFTAESDVAVWRTRGDQHQLVGEFSFQCKFQRRQELSAKALLKCEEFFKLLQCEAQDWISLGTTKTGAVYRLKGNPPQSHE
ncbi:hypothetical protein [Methylocystis parvus]|uniref:Uncharacterized protein n=1 Tax=Methylocystis parvus TaxID=134 RepID=A0A6B8M8I9_9HYPH|nr:hypothetical protein [Methylocystis parvus]QGM97643.1 hypothetical protein F7D14_09330 [Methylocystis parvus]WBJ98423.1 hypothetical protein MMG94_10265 [Methylocystis parvus OBBP]